MTVMTKIGQKKGVGPLKLKFSFGTAFYVVLCIYVYVYVRIYICICICMVLCIYNNNIVASMKKSYGVVIEK